MEKWEEKVAFIAGFVLKVWTTLFCSSNHRMDSPELRAIHHIGYENVADDRQDVTELWTDPEVRDVNRPIGY